MKCTRCKAPAVVALPSHNAAFCPECFLDFFSKQVDKGIREHGLMTRQDKVLVALSGGKDSLALLATLARLREFYPDPFTLEALTVDMGIPEMDFTPVAEYCRSLGIPELSQQLLQEQDRHES